MRDFRPDSNSLGGKSLLSHARFSEAERLFMTFTVVERLSGYAPMETLLRGHFGLELMESGPLGAMLLVSYRSLRNPGEVSRGENRRNVATTL